MCTPKMYKNVYSDIIHNREKSLSIVEKLSKLWCVVNLLQYNSIQQWNEMNYYCIELIDKFPKTDIE